MALGVHTFRPHSALQGCTPVKAAQQGAAACAQPATLISTGPIKEVTPAAQGVRLSIEGFTNGRCCSRYQRKGVEVCLNAVDLGNLTACFVIISIDTYTWQPVVFKKWVRHAQSDPLPSMPNSRPVELGPAISCVQSSAASQQALSAGKCISHVLILLQKAEILLSFNVHLPFSISRRIPSIASANAISQGPSCQAHYLSIWRSS